MKRKLLIIGAGGNGKVIADIACKLNMWEDIAFLDDDYRLKGVMGFDVLGGVADACKYVSEADIFVAIGDNAIRENMQKKVSALGMSVPVMIHPSAIIGKNVEIGAGTVIMAGVVINCCTSIGDGCIINTGATVDHDSVLEEYVHISPGVHLAGNVKIGRKTFIGVGSAVSNNVRIMENCKMGAGAVVIKDINESGLYVGVPVKKIQ